VSTHNEATRNPWRGSIPIVAGDNLRPGAAAAEANGMSPDGALDNMTDTASQQGASS